MLFYPSLIAAIFPMVFYLILLWRFDKYEREPITLVLKHFLWGAFGAIVLSLVFSQLFSNTINLFTVSDATTSLLSVILIAPFVEEIMKGSYLLKTTKNDEFDNLTDGLVYGGAIGLGFGMTENFFYFTSYADNMSDWIYLVIVRTGFSAVMHCIATSIVGSFLAMAKYASKKRKYFYFSAGLFIAMFIHFLWNFSVSFESTYLFGYLLLFVIILVYLATLRYSLSRERKIIFSELNNEELPEFVIDYFNLSKNSNSKIKKDKHLKATIALFSKLAFCKYMLRNKKGSEFKFEEKINNIRLQILELQNNKEEGF